MDIRPIHSEADYDWALEEISSYFEHEPLPGTPDADRFDVLSALIGAYEDKHWPVKAPDAVAAVREAMDLQGFTQSDLATLLGSRSRASEMLSGQRAISMAQAWELHSKWGIPAELLIRPAGKAA